MPAMISLLLVKDVSMKTKSLTSVLVMMLGAMGLYSCSQADKTTAVAADQASSKSLFISSIPYQKPGAAVGFRHEIDGGVKPGQLTNVRLFIRDGYDSGTLSVKVLANPDLGVTEQNISYSMSSDLENQLDIPVTTPLEGSHYINIKAVADMGDGQYIPRNHAVQLSVGDAAAQKQSYRSKQVDTPVQKSERGIIVMEAEEVIIQQK